MSERTAFRRPVELARARALGDDRFSPMPRTRTVLRPLAGEQHVTGSACDRLAGHAPAQVGAAARVYAAGGGAR